MRPHLAAPVRIHGNALDGHPRDRKEESVHIAGAPTWRVNSRGGDPWMHRALFVRDALDLDVPGQAVPRLLGHVRDRSELLRDASHDEVSRAWSRWWVDIVASRAQADTAPSQTDIGDNARAHSRPAPMPRDPLLRRALDDTSADAETWFAAYRHEDRIARRTAHPGNSSYVTARAAEATACRLGVSASELHAFVLVIGVRDSWWQRPAPAVLLCSPEASLDDEQWYAALCEAFASSLA